MPPCVNRTLNRDTNLQLIPSERFAAFVRAIRKKWRPWLQQLGLKMREAVQETGMPAAAISHKNRAPILEYDFADNAFACASIQFMHEGASEDGWHRRRLLLAACVRDAFRDTPWR